MPHLSDWHTYPVNSRAPPSCSSRTNAWACYETQWISPCGVARKPEPEQRPHAFSEPLSRRVRYLRPRSVLLGIVWSVWRRPLHLLRTVGRAVSAALVDPARARKHIGALTVAFAAVRSESQRGCQWIHTDFLQGCTTTSWHLSTLLGVPFSATGHAFDKRLHELQQLDLLDEPHPVVFGGFGSG